MSYTYGLYCKQTNEYLDLGKIITIDLNGKDVPIQFQGFGLDLSTNNSLSLLDNWRLVERFLIKNKMKEIKLVPYAFIEKIDPDNKIIQFIDSKKDFFEKTKHLEISYNAETEEFLNNEINDLIKNENKLD